MLNLILGRSGTGKTEYVRNLLGEMAQAGENKLLLIVPEQFSYSCERALLEKLGPVIANKIEVLSFSRLTDFVNRQVGGISGARLDDADKIILLLHALYGIQDSLEFYKLQADKTYFAKDLISLFSEFNKQRISSDDLKETENNTLNKKLQDIKFIFNEFNSLLELNGYTDEDLEINQVIKAIKENNIFEGYTICIDAFKGFTGQELAIIKELENKAKEVYVTFTYDENDSSMIFGAVKETINSLQNKGKIIELKENRRTEKDSLLFLEQNIFTSNIEKFNGKNSDITLFEADTKYDECNFIAATIRKLQREENMRLSDIAVVTRHEDNYKAELLSALKRFGIEIFEDKRQPIEMQPLIVYCRALISLLTKKELNTKDILTILKTGLINMKETDCLDLENYAFIWNITGDEWAKDFINCEKDKEEELVPINNNRKAILDPIIELKSKLPYDCKVKSLDICKCVYEYLEKVDVKSGLLRYAKRLSNNGYEDVATEQNKVWEILTEVLNKLATIQGDDPITLPMFYELFCSICEMATLGTLPHGLDELTLGSADRIRLNNPKVVFVCGCIEGEFPQNIGGSNLLTNNDRKIINKELELSLSLSNELAACDERFMAYAAVTSSREKLYVSYHTKAGASDALSPSIIYSDIKERFENINKLSQKDLGPYFYSETSEATFKTYASGFHKRSTLNAVEYNTLKASLKGDDKYEKKFDALDEVITNAPKEIKDKEIAKKLFGEHMGLSASRIETYYNCPFQYFCKYGLGVYPIKRVSLDAQLRGKVIHYVLEQILRNNSKEDFQNFSASQKEEQVELYLKKYLEENYKGDTLKDVSFKYKYNALVKMLKDIIERMIEEFKVSDFEPIEFEYDVRDSYEKASIKGDIDRVDKFIAPDGTTYIRVVDYKSYIKTFSLDHVIKGLNLQMLIYLFAAKKQLDVTPAGILYYKASRMNTSLDSREISDEEIFEKKIKDNISSGIFLNEENVLNAMENGKAGRFYNFNTENLVTLEELGKVEEEVERQINQMVISLNDGHVPIFPSVEGNEIKGCSYCDYSHVCGYEGDPSLYNIVEKLKKDEVMSIMEGEIINE